ncbi:MAG: hypothetical protein ACYC2H_02295 [Thermoplasmatota archaeon]
MTDNLPFNQPPYDTRTPYNQNTNRQNEVLGNIVAGTIALGIAIGIGTLIGRALR